MMANLTAQIMELRKNLKNQEENNAQVKQQLEKQTKVHPSELSKFMCTVENIKIY